MCFDLRAAKILDPGGYIAEKTTPKAFAPFSGLHGTSKAFQDMQPNPSRPALTTATPGSVAPPKSASQKLLGE